MANCTYITLEEWICELAYDERLTGDERKVAVFAVTLQDASNPVMMRICKVGKQNLLDIKRRLIQLEIISIGGLEKGGRGNKRRITGTLPGGRVVLLESEYDAETGSEENRFGDIEKGSESGSETGLKEVSKGSKRGSVENLFKVSPPPKDIYSNPPPLQKDIPQTPKGASNDFWNILKTDDYDRGVRFTDDGIMLVNGTKQQWLERFNFDEDGLSLALEEIAGRIQKNNRNTPPEQQVLSQLANMVRNTRSQDQRYQKAVERNQKNKQKQFDKHHQKFTPSPEVQKQMDEKSWAESMLGLK